MTNLNEYIKWRGDIRFTESGINDIDSLIFTELAYLPFEEIVPHFDEGEAVSLSEVGKKFFEINDENISIGAIMPSKELVGLLKQVKDTRRFKEVTAWGYVNDIDIESEYQFSAICFSIGGNITYVAYRGTDDTIIGWKENFNMAFFTPIPSQKYGAEYLSRVAEHTKDKLYVGGHSKGGNLAVYSALFTSRKSKKKIIKVNSFDGPGFQEDFINSIDDENTISKITNFVPDSSTVGMIFDLIGECRIVKSNYKGLRQHDAFSWGVLGCEFIGTDTLSKSAIDFHVLLKKWVDNMTREEKIEFVESLYKISTITDATTLSEIGSDKLKFIIAILKTDDKTKKAVFLAVRNLIKAKYVKTEGSELKKEKTALAVKAAKEDAKTSKNKNGAEKKTVKTIKIKPKDSTN